MVYYEDKKYSKALEYYQKALSIWQKHLPEDHSHFGAVYRYLGQHDLALKFLPPEHPNIAATLENIGLVYEQKYDIQQALSIFLIIHYLRLIRMSLVLKKIFNESHQN